MEFINMISELFKVELAFKVQKLTPDQIKVRRERRSKTILSKETYDKRQLLLCYIKIQVKLGKLFFLRNPHNRLKNSREMRCGEK